MGIKYFRPKGRGIKPQEIIKQNRRVDKQSASTISAVNNLKPTTALRNPDTNSGGCTVSTNRPDVLLLVSHEMTARQKLNIRKMNKSFFTFSSKTNDK